MRGKGSERGRAAQVHLICYADDFVMTGHSEELLKMTVKPLVESFLQERGLVLSPEKTESRTCRRIRLPWTERPALSEREALNQAL